MGKREDRIQKLVELTNTSDNLHVKDAARLLNVSEMTIRRDINNMPSSPIHLLGGYIVHSSERKNISHYFVSEQQKRNIHEKKYIGRVAAALVQENDTVFFDCGTTIPYIIENIPDHIHFTGVCYSINVFLALQTKENCKVILCGGRFEVDNAIFLPINEQSPLDIICPSKSFISAAGISLKGVTCFNLPEVGWKIKAMNKSNTTILVADSSKFDEQRSACFGELSDFDILVTDHIDHKYLLYCQKNNIVTYQ